MSADDVPPLPDPIALFAEPMLTLGRPLMVTGGYAVSAWSVPRMTQDVDFVVALEQDDVPRLLAVFPADQFLVPPEEVLREEIARPTGGHFNLLHLESFTRADVYPAGTRTEVGAELARAEALEVAPGLRVPFIAPGDLVLQKLAWIRAGGTDRHFRDARAILRVRADVLDAVALATEARRRGLAELWERMMAHPEG